ncbi:MAG: LptF/LptG family permease [Candidatus Omnitrophota bacterium]
MKILRNYILKEFFGPFFTSLIALTMIMLLGNLIRLADLIINKGVDLYSVTKLFIFLMPALLTYTLPLAVLVAILLSLGRLAGDNEVTAMRASGISILRMVITPLLIIGLMLSLILVILNDQVVPYVHFASRRTLNSIGIKNPAAALEAGTFIDSFDKYVIFIYQIDGNQLNQVRIYEPRADNTPCRTIVAKSGEFVSIPEDKMIKLKLINGTSDEPDLNNPGRFYKLNFKTLFLNLNLNKGGQNQIQKKPKDMTMAEIRLKIENFKASGIEIFPLVTELHKRIALAFSVIVFIILGCGLAMITRRREKSINFSMAFSVSVIYYLLLLGASAFSLQGHLWPALAMWLPNMIMGTVALILMIKVCAY